MRDDYEFLLALSDEADEEVRSQIRMICEMQTIVRPVGPPRRVALPRRPETDRHDAR